jgi:glycogen debranching enzyme
MAMFGRDSLITAYQTLILGQDLALGTIDRLAYFQGKEVNTLKEEEPGKILHEIRFGEFAHFKEWVQFPYYGTVDATPLFLILISEVYRWSGDEEFVNHYKEHIKKALEWIDEYGDMDKDGFVEYKKQTPSGLDNQNWRDSWDSMAYVNGAEAEPPIAAADVQGYVYDAKLRMAELARNVWKDKNWAESLEEQAKTLKKNFNKAFYVEKGRYFALGLDKNKNHIDSLASSNGQILWSGIVDDDKIPDVIKQLKSPSLYSGWGVRTMGTTSKAYNPIGYHVGTVWPHDNSLIVNGLKNVNETAFMNTLITDMVTASTYFDYRLPEVFAGYDRSSTPFPVQYPTASSPQAWAAGTAVLFIQMILGLKPDPVNKTIKIDPHLPDHVNFIRLDGVSAFGKNFLVEVTRDAATIKEVESYTCFICKEKIKDGHKHSSFMRNY